MNMFRALMELDKLYEDTITEAPIKKFASNIDSAILDNIDSELPTELITNSTSNNTHCGKSAVKNALYLVSIGKEAKFCLGNMYQAGRPPELLGQIKHCWVEYSGGVVQTHLPPQKIELLLRYSVDLVPNDVEASKKLIVDLVNGINNGTITESIFDDRPISRSNFVTASGKQVKIPSARASFTQQSRVAPAQSSTPAAGKYMVGIVLDKGRLRAMSNDGVHGVAFVAFPNNLRQFEGQRYEVDQLIWNGKNYRVAGNIKEI